MFKHCMFEHRENKSNCSLMARDFLTKVRKDRASPSIMSLMHSWLGNSCCNRSSYYKPRILTTKISFLIWNSLCFPWTFSTWNSTFGLMYSCQHPPCYLSLRRTSTLIFVWFPCLSRAALRCLVTFACLQQGPWWATSTSIYWFC